MLVARLLTSYYRKSFISNSKMSFKEKIQLLFLSNTRIRLIVDASLYQQLDFIITSSIINIIEILISTLKTTKNDHDKVVYILCIENLISNFEIFLIS